MSGPPGGADDANDRGLARRYASVIVKLRWVVVAAFVAAGAALAGGPAPELSSQSSFESVLPEDLPAIRTQLDALRTFGFPVLARTAVVQRDPDGLSVAAQARVFLHAAELNLHSLPGLETIAGALPVTNTAGLFPSSQEENTTAVTYLFFRPEVGIDRRVRLAHEYARRYLDHSDDGYIGVAGAIPARQAQGRLLVSSLPLVELGSLIVVVLVVGLTFRSVVAPLVVVGVAGFAFLVATRSLGWVAAQWGSGVPAEVKPLLLVLLAGLTTDYAVFFLSSARDWSATGADRLETAHRATAETAPIVLTAGLAVGAALSMLLLARLPLFARLGPSLAFSVAVAVIVSVTAVPAALGVLGRVTFWPSTGRRDLGDPGLSPVFRRRLIAAAVSVVVAGVLVSVPVLLGRSGLGINLTGGLPAGSEPVRAARAAGRGLGAGITGPVEIVVEGHGVADRRSELAALQEMLRHRPGVAGVLGPSHQPLPFDLGVFRASSGDAARYVVILDDDPFSAGGLDRIRALREQMPALMKQAGLSNARAAFTGDAVLGATLTAMAVHDLAWVGTAVVAVDLLVLAVFLRAVLAPLLLAGARALGGVAALALTAWTSKELLGVQGLTFYVPLAVAVLLLSFGTDYNLLVTGRVWSRAKDLGVHDAVALAGREARRPVLSAGFALAVSFALLALVPLAGFRQLAVAMFVGVLLEAVVVALVFVPAALAVFRSWAAWPNRSVSRGPVAGMADRRPPADESDVTVPLHPPGSDPSAVSGPGRPGTPT